MNFRTSFLVVPAFAVVFAVVQGCDVAPKPSDTTVTAENPITGEQKQYPSQKAVPPGWVVCSGVCPPRVNCGELDEAGCLERVDCAPLYGPTPASFTSCVEAAPTCSPSSCGPALGLPAKICEDGSIGGNTGRCIQAPNAPSCEWEIRVCPEDACAPTDCTGPKPAIAWKCSDGTVGGPECEQTTQGCQWVIEMCEQDKCLPTECGPNPFGVPNIQCADGSIAGPTCLRGGNGVCGWKITSCP